VKITDFDTPKKGTPNNAGSVESLAASIAALLGLLQEQTEFLQECRLHLRALGLYAGWIGFKLGIPPEELQKMLDTSFSIARQEEAKAGTPDLSREMAFNVRAITEMGKPGAGLSN
jgi:hypothetical protein